VLGKTPFDFIVPEQVQEMRAAYERIMRSKTPIHGLESRIVCKNGGECVVETNAVPAFDSAHRLLGYRGISRDITGRRQAEEEARLQEQQLIQADKMTSLGLLVSGVAHEINNPNHFILGNAQSLQGLWEGAVPVLERYYQEHGDFRMGGLNFSKARQFLPDLIRGIQEGAGRIKVIVQELRDYARQEPTYLKEKVNMNGVVESATILMSNMIKKRTNHFSVYYDEALPEVLGNFQRLEQVVINLIQNGCEALDNPENGLTVRTEYDPQKALISVSVEDEGCGIAPEHLSHVTDPFFTTKRDSGGTGLGLSVSSGIVKEHGGTLRFVSTLGQGTISIIELPCPE